MNEIKLLHLHKLEPIFTTFLLHKYGKKVFKNPVFGYKNAYFANFFQIWPLAI